MKYRLKKQEIISLLKEEARSLDEVRQVFSLYPASSLINTLFPALCSHKAQVRWRAVSCMGEAVARLACENLEAARVVMRRFMWSLNDESGGIGWGVPESMAEAMCRCVALAQEYAHILLSYVREDGPECWQEGNFLEHPALQEGALWGLARLSETRPDILGRLGAGPEIAAFLTRDSAMLRALACLILGRLRRHELRPALAGLTHEASPVCLYMADGTFCRTSLGKLAQEALFRLQTGAESGG